MTDTSSTSISAPNEPQSMLPASVPAASAESSISSARQQLSEQLERLMQQGLEAARGTPGSFQVEPPDTKQPPHSGAGIIVATLDPYAMLKYPTCVCVPHILLVELCLSFGCTVCSQLEQRSNNQIGGRLRLVRRRVRRDFVCSKISIVCSCFVMCNCVCDPSEVRSSQFELCEFGQRASRATRTSRTSDSHLVPAVSRGPAERRAEAAPTKEYFDYSSVHFSIQQRLECKQIIRAHSWCTCT